MPWSSISARPEGVCSSSGSGFVDAVVGSDGERWRGTVGMFVGGSRVRRVGGVCASSGPLEGGEGGKGTKKREYMTRVGFEPTLFPKIGRAHV